MTPGADTTDVLQGAVSLPLRLKSFTTNGLPSPAVLENLQSTGVQYLQIGFYPIDVPDGFFSSLGNLQSLNNLTVTHRSTPEIDYLPAEVAAVVGQLQNLTCLSIHCMTPAGSRYLPASLKALYLCCPMKGSVDAQDTESAPDGIISLTHLTALTGLQWHSSSGLAGVCDVTLPQQPLQLWTSGKLHLVGSQHLPLLDIVASCGYGLEFVEDLSSYTNTTLLAVNLPHAVDVPWDLRTVLSRTLGAFTNLREFTFKARGQIYKLRPWGHPYIIDELCKLPLLTKVTLACVDDCYEGCEILNLLHLSALTKLTSLDVVDWAGVGLNDSAAAAIASSLTRLQELHLCSNSIVTWDVLPAIARLTSLRSLRLQTLSCLRYGKMHHQYHALHGDSNSSWGAPNVPDIDGPHITQPMLQQLSALTCLTRLELRLSHVDAEQQQQFLAGMPSLRGKGSVVDFS
jgi:hypothetical protein